MATVLASLVANAALGGGTAVLGGGKFENGAITSAFGYLFNSQFHSHTAVPFVDDQGDPVLDYQGNQMMRPSDVFPNFFVDAAAWRGSLYADGLNNFQQRGDWDVQRVDTDRDPTKAFIDFATVSIGLYGAARGISADTLLSIEDWYAAGHSNFGPVTMDPTYTHLPETNVWNTRLGYDLYLSGRIGR